MRQTCLRCEAINGYAIVLVLLFGLYGLAQLTNTPFGGRNIPSVLVSLGLVSLCTASRQHLDAVDEQEALSAILQALDSTHICFLGFPLTLELLGLVLQCRAKHAIIRISSL